LQHEDVPPQVAPLGRRVGPEDVNAVATFEGERERLVGLAYRITGSRTDADDVVQEAWLRWDRSDQDAVERPGAWLTTVTSRIALDRLRSAQRAREAYVGPWLPEVAVTEAGPAERVELAESLTVGFLAVLERLGPVERVVFLLSDVFAVPFDEIATVADRSPEACRQIASRARKRVREDRPRFHATDDEAWRVAAAFLAGVQAGDIDTVLGLLAPDAIAVSDGGRDHHAARRPVVGPDRVARLVLNLTSRMPPDMTIEVRLINGQPGVLFTRRGRPYMATAVDVVDGLVVGLYSVVNPEKLAALDRPIS
jgi:RNA polymerase sigma-70 factor (ECF subfamily)